MRYFDKNTKTEAVDGVHFNSDNMPSHIVPLDDTNVFFTNIPESKEIEYTNDEPTSLVDRPIDHKAIKWAECKAIREAKKHENFAYRDWVFEAREIDVSNIERKLRVINNGDIVQWMDVNNQPHPFSDGDLHDMLKIIVERGEMLYLKSWEVREIIENSNSPQLLDIPTLYEGKIDEN